MLDAIRARRSIRSYEDRSIEPAVIEQLEEAMLRAPSSRNLKPWHFVFVTDPTLLERLSHAKANYGGFISGSRLGVVVCGNSAVSDCWIEDCSIAATVLQLAATELGLGSCWVQIRARTHADGLPAEEHVREILSLPAELGVLCMIAVGYPAEAKAPKDSGSLDWGKVELR